MSEASFAELRRKAALVHAAQQPESVESLAEERLRQLVFQGYWPYAHAASGTVSGLKKLSLSDVTRLYARGMRLDLAVLSIVGNFSEVDARRLVRLLFAGALADGRAGEPPLLEPPRQTSHRFSTIVDARAKGPMALYGWPTPGRARAITTRCNSWRRCSAIGVIRARLARSRHHGPTSAWLPGPFPTAAQDVDPDCPTSTFERRRHRGRECAASRAGYPTRSGAADSGRAGRRRYRAGSPLLRSQGW
jgi:hypothetical protein